MADRSALAQAVGIYRRLVGARSRADWQYRLSFALLTLSQLLATSLDLLAIVVLFERVDTIAGWTLPEVLLLYGTAGVAFGLADLFVSPVERLSFHVRQGSFDQFLLRPIGPLLQLSADGFAVRRAGKLAQPVVVLIVAVAQVGVHWTIARAAMLAVTIVAGTIIFSAFWVATSAIAVWTVETQEVANAFTYGGSFATQYPLDILSGWVRRLALLVPIAFINYLPITWILRRPDALGLPGWARFLSPLVAGVLLLAAGGIWRAAIRHYRSTGS